MARGGACLAFDCRVSDTGVRYVLESASGANLKELNLTNLTKVGDVTLLRISQM